MLRPCVLPYGISRSCCGGRAADPTLLFFFCIGLGGGAAAEPFSVAQLICSPVTCSATGLALLAKGKGCAGSDTTCSNLGGTSLCIAHAHGVLFRSSSPTTMPKEDRRQKIGRKQTRQLQLEQLELPIQLSFNQLGGGARSGQVRSGILLTVSLCGDCCVGAEASAPIVRLFACAVGKLGLRRPDVERVEQWSVIKRGRVIVAFLNPQRHR